MAFFETRSENAVSASLHFLSAKALEKWRGLLPRAGPLIVRGAHQSVALLFETWTFDTWDTHDD
jgi:hypothetical protein